MGRSGPASAKPELLWTEESGSNFCVGRPAPKAFEIGDKDLLSGGEDFLKQHLDHPCLIDVRLRRRQVLESRPDRFAPERVLAWPQEGRGGRRVGSSRASIRGSPVLA